MNRAWHIELKEFVILLVLPVSPRPQQPRIHAGAQQRAFMTVLGKEDTQGGRLGPWALRRALGATHWPAHGLMRPHVHTDPYRVTHTHTGIPVAASPLLSFHGSGAGRGRQWVQCQGRALLLNARTALGLNGQGPGCRSPRGLAIQPLWATGL